VKQTDGPIDSQCC